MTRKLAITAGLTVLCARAAWGLGAGCSYTSGPLLLEKPRATASGAQMTGCIQRTFDVLSSGAASTTTAAAFLLWQSTVSPKIAGFELWQSTLSPAFFQLDADLTQEISDRQSGDTASMVAASTGTAAALARADAANVAATTGTAAAFAAINSTGAALSIETAARIAADSTKADVFVGISSPCPWGFSITTPTVVNGIITGGQCELVSGGSSGGVTPYVDNLCGTNSGPLACTGAQTVYDITAEPANKNAIWLSRDGITLTYGAGFTYSGKTITLAVAPTAETTDLVAHYLVYSSTNPAAFILNVQNTVSSQTFFAAPMEAQAVGTSTYSITTSSGILVQSGIVSAPAFVGGLVGNAATVTNGVYTSGSYSDPTWLTGLAGSKVSGNIPGNAANITGNLSTAQIDLSTVTTALAGKLATNGSAASLTNIPAAQIVGAVPAVSVDLSTVTTALAGKLSNSAGIDPALVDLSTVTTALAGKLSNHIADDLAADGGVTASSITSRGGGVFWGQTEFKSIQDTLEPVVQVSSQGENGMLTIYGSGDITFGDGGAKASTYTALTGDLKIAGSMTASAYYGSGANLTGVTGGHTISTGTRNGPWGNFTTRTNLNFDSTYFVATDSATGNGTHITMSTTVASLPNAAFVVAVSTVASYNRDLGPCVLGSTLTLSNVQAGSDLLLTVNAIAVNGVADETGDLTAIVDGQVYSDVIVNAAFNTPTPNRYSNVSFPLVVKNATAGTHTACVSFWNVTGATLYILNAGLTELRANSVVPASEVAMLNSTQTFTAMQNFSGSVTLSSAIYSAHFGSSTITAATGVAGSTFTGIVGSTVSLVVSGGNEVICTLMFDGLQASAQSGTTWTYINFLVDGVVNGAFGDGGMHIVDYSVADYHKTFTYVHPTGPLTAGVHTISAQAKTNDTWFSVRGDYMRGYMYCAEQH